MMVGEAAGTDVDALNDRLARAHSIDDYYARSPLLVRVVERRRFALIRTFMGDVSNLDVLEIGSGGGHVLQMFPRARLTAVDVSGAYLEIAKRNLAGYKVTFLKGEIDNLSLPDASFDRVICTEVLEHVVDPEPILAAIGRLLRPNGVAAITIPNDMLIGSVKAVIRRRPFKWVVRGEFDWGGDEYHIHQWTSGEFVRLLERHLHVVQGRAVPVGALPVRYCFKCTSKTARDG